MAEIDLDDVRAQIAGLPGVPTAVEVADSLRRLGHVVSDTTVRATLETLRRESEGAGPLEGLLRLPGVTDVLVNGPAAVYVDRGDGLERTQVTFPSDEHVRRLAVRIAAMCGRRLDEGSPTVDARLPDGTRVHAVLACLSDVGTCLSLRIPPRRTFALEDWVANGSLPEEGAALLRALVDSRAAFLVSGGTGSGKTTLLAGLLSLVPVDQRLVVVEDSRELNPAHPHCIRLEARQPNAEGAGSVSLADLVRQALRMRPDRLVVGEVRGAEICDLLNAFNTGHEGGAGTIHANSATDVMARIEALAALGGLSRDAVHAQAAPALDAVIHVRREAKGRRRVTQVGVLRADERTGLVRLVEAVAFAEDRRLVRGPGYADLEEVLDR